MDVIDQERSRSENLARAFVTVVEADASDGLAGVPSSVLRDAAVAVALVARESALLGSIVSAAGRRGETVPPRAARLLGKICDVAYAAGDHLLSQILDWFAKAWLGEPFNSSFYGPRQLPDDLYEALAAIIDRATPQPAMICAAAREELIRVLADLEKDSLRLSAIDRDVTRSLFVRPVAEVVASVRAGRPADGGLLGARPEDLVAVANRSLREPIPTNGRRWPLLVRATEQIQEYVLRAVELGRVAAGAGDLPALNGHDLPAPLDELLATGLTAVEAAPDGARVIESVARAALVQAGSPGLRCRVAAFLDGLDVAAAEVEDALSPLQDLHERVLEQAARSPDDAEVEELVTLIGQGIADYDLEYAREGMELLTATVRGEALRQRLARLDRRAAGLPPDRARSVGPHLRAARVAIDEQRFDDAEFHLREVDGVNDPTTHPASPAVAAPSAGIAALPSVGSLEDFRRRRTALAADELAEAVERAAAAGDHRELPALLRRLGQAGSGEAVEAALARFAEDEPLSEALISGVPARQRPAMLYKLAEVLNARGETTRAELALLRCRPPVPPDDLTVADPLPGADLLVPRTRARVEAGPGDSSSELERADALAAEARDGAALSLGWAVAQYVIAGQPATGLRLYGECARQFYGNASLTWNLVCAYAMVGHRERAVATAVYFVDLFADRAAAEQRSALAEFLRLNDAPVPEWPEQPTGATAAGGLHAVQAQERAAKLLYEQGEVEMALRKVRRLLRAVPNSPAAFLLLRICREQRWPEQAEQSVAELAAVGAANWRHYCELARIAVEVGHPQRAEAHLQQAAGLGASVDALHRVRERIDADRAPSGAGLTSAIDRTATLGNATSPRGLVYEVRAAIAAPHDTSILMDLARRVLGAIPSAARILVDEIEKVPHTDELVRALVGSLPAAGPLAAVLALATELGRVGRTTDAIDLLRNTEAVVRPTELPRVWLVLHRVMRQAGIDPDGEQGGWLRLPAESAKPRANGADFAPPPWFTDIVPVASTPPEVRRAHQVQLEQGPAAAAPLWKLAVEAGYGLALPNALGALVETGQAADAVALFQQVSDRIYLVASAAWNLGCAYAHLGDLDSAGAAFEYHARVTSRTYLPEQRAALEKLFAELGRPVPMTVTHPGARAVPPKPHGDAAPPGQADTARTIEAFHRQPDPHRFIAASSALRAEMADARLDRRRLLLAEIEEMFAQLESRTPHAYAERIRAVAIAGDDERAWAMTLACLDEFGGAADILAAALALATTTARAGQLETALSEHAEDGDYAQYLTLAKLARARGDREACQRYARAALDRNPSSAEAHRLLGKGAEPEKSQPLGQRRSTLERLVRSMKTRDPDKVLARLPDYQAEIEYLYRRAINALTPLPPQQDEFVAIEELAQPFVDAGRRAARNEDWSLAATEFGRALEVQPRHLGVARNAASALFHVGRFAEARAIAESISYSAKGRQLLAQLAYAAGDYEEAAALLAELAAVESRQANDYVFALAGVHLYLRQRPRDAAEALLRRAEAVLPGRPEFSAALAAVIAKQHGHDDIVRSAVAALFRPRLTSRQAVAWAIERDALELLGTRRAPELESHDLEKLVAHFAPGDPDRLLGFLRRQAEHATDGRRRRELGLLHARVAEECGRVEEAFSARLGLVDRDAPDRRAMLADLMEFCKRTQYLDGLERVLAVKREWGLPLTPSDKAAAEAQRNSVGYRQNVFREKIRAVLWQIQRIRLGEDVGGVEAPLADLTDHLLGYTEGTPTAQVVERLAELWRRSVALLPRLAEPAGRPDLKDLRSEFLTANRKIRSLQTGLGSEVVEEAAETVGKWLYTRWEQIARDERDAATAIELEVTATRVAGGPVEAVVALNVHADIRELRVRLAGETSNLGEVAADDRRLEGFCVDTAAEELTLSVTFQTADGLQDEIVEQVRVDTVDESARPVRSLFTPNTAATGNMFRGREAELNKLRLEYGEAHSRNATIRSLTGPRKVGKTSLLGWLKVDSAPAAWRIPHVLPVYLDVSTLQSEDNPLRCIAEEIAAAVSTLAERGLFPEPVPALAAGLDDAQSFIRWCRQVREACRERIGFLVILDEVHELLKKLQSRNAVGWVAASLRAAVNSGAIALLLCGSCTGATLKALLAGTALQDELQSDTLGYLDRRATERVFAEGFGGTARVLPEATDEVWRLTEGHPNHIHHLGEKIAQRLGADRRRLVTRRLVSEIGLEIAKTSIATIGIVTLENEGPDGRDLLVQLANQAQGAIDLGETTELRRRFDARHMEQIDRYVLIGLLRVDREQYRWANEIINLHVQHFAQRESANLRLSMEESHLHANEYETLQVYSHEASGTRMVSHEGQYFTAKRITYGIETGAGRPRDGSPAPASGEAAKSVHEFLNHVSRTPVAGVPRYAGKVGDWFLSDHAVGRSLAEFVHMQRDVPTEPARAVRWVADACDVVERVWGSLGVTHGNLKPGNVIVDETTVSVIDWGRGTRDGFANPISGGTLGYMSPGYLRRLEHDEGGARPTDDVFALGVVLYQMLHPNGALPYGDDLTDLDRAEPPVGARPLPVEFPLLTCVSRAIALSDEHRYATAAEFARDLRLAVPAAAPITTAEPAQRPAAADPVPNAYPYPYVTFNVNANNEMGDRQVSKDRIDIKGSSVTNSVVGNRNRIRTFAPNSGGEASELQATLAELQAAVEALRAELPADVADGLGRDVAVFVEEATAEAPRRGRLERMGSDIAEAAESISKTASVFQKVGAPVINLVNEVIHLIQG